LDLSLPTADALDARSRATVQQQQVQALRPASEQLAIRVAQSQVHERAILPPQNSVRSVHNGPFLLFAGPEQVQPIPGNLNQHHAISVRRAWASRSINLFIPPTARRYPSDTPLPQWGLFILLVLVSVVDSGGSRCVATG
jgi:hypothetical protein